MSQLGTAPARCKDAARHRVLLHDRLGATQPPSPYDSPRYPSATPDAVTTVRRAPAAAERRVPRQRARHVYRRSRRHAVGHRGSLPEAAVALARDLADEPRPDPQPALDLSRPGHHPRSRDRHDAPAAAAPNANGTVKLSPQVRVEAGAMPSRASPPEAIEPYLTQPLIVETADDARSAARRGVARARRARCPAISRTSRASPIRRSPSTSCSGRAGRCATRTPAQVIAYQADYLGTARVTRPGNPATITITSSKMEINAGDRLVRRDEAGRHQLHAARAARSRSPAASSRPIRAWRPRGRT